MSASTAPGSASTDADTIDEMGPIDFYAIEFPNQHFSGEGLPYFLDLVDRGIVRLLDLIVIAKGNDGAVSDQQGGCPAIGGGERDQTPAAYRRLRADVNDLAQAEQAGRMAGRRPDRSAATVQSGQGAAQTGLGRNSHSQL